jgi:glycerol-3-phosphate dehydrogenase (NAD(P)+)
VLGAGSWGTTLAALFARQGHEVSIWAREREIVEEINTSHRNSRFQPQLELPEDLHAFSERDAAIQDRDVAVLSVPLQFLRGVLKETQHLLTHQILVGTAKGIEQQTGKLSQEICADEILSFDAERYAALSGPTIAIEVAAGLPTSAVIACAHEATSAKLQAAFSSRVMRLYRSKDLHGVEFAGAMKNVIALAAGMCDGMRLGVNAKGTLITRGLAELSRLGEALGGQRKTFSGLSGMGDLVTTCVSEHSRNRRVGEYIASGMQLEDALEKTGQVAEGVWSAEAASVLGERHAVSVPITDAVCAVLSGKMSAREAVQSLMERALKEED